MYDNKQIAGLVLAGGQASRLGGQDKGLYPYQGRPLITHTLARFAPQVGPIWISANRNIDEYTRLGFPVVQDAGTESLGPLAGVLAGLQASTLPLTACVPCDTPHLPTDLVERLYKAIDAGNSDAAVAVSDGQTHALCSLVKTSLAENLAAYLEAGGRSVQGWLGGLRCARVVFDDAPDAFRNLNTPEDFQPASDNTTNVSLR